MLAALIYALMVSPMSAAEAVTVPAAASGPQLRIAVDNGHTTAVAGDSMTYTVTIQNLGTMAASGLEITQSVPTGLKFDSADAGGTMTAGKVWWKLDLKATKSALFHTRMTVVATPKDLLRLATVACANSAGGPDPIVCAAHSDELPAGAAAAAQQADSAAAGPAGRSGLWWYVGGGIAVLVGAAAFVLWRSRRRSAAALVR